MIINILRKCKYYDTNFYKKQPNTMVVYSKFILHKTLHKLHVIIH